MSILNRFFNKTKYQPLNNIFIDKNRIRDNYKILSEINPHISLIPVLKSNAYGHGIVEISNIVSELEPKFIAVDSIFEGYQLLNNRIKTKILIMGYVNYLNLKVKSLPFSYAVFNLEYALNILMVQPNAKIHLFIDTGMNREGINISDIQEFINKLKEKNLINNLEGVMSHFASADEDLNPQTDLQLKVFNDAIKIFEKSKVEIKYKQIAATFGVLNNKNSSCNTARIGLALYGYGNDNLKPALKLTSKVVQIKSINKNEFVGYNGTFISNSDMKIGILPIGYNDGLDRRLSNKGFVSIRGVYCPIIGKISMNITTVDISNLYNIFKDINNRDILDSEVLIISNNSEDKNSIKSISEICQTIEWEILVKLNPSIKRNVTYEIFKI